jgi:hypothetical protein
MNAGIGIFFKTATAYAPCHGGTRIGSASKNDGWWPGPFSSSS